MTDDSGGAGSLGSSGRRLGALLPLCLGLLGIAMCRVAPAATEIDGPRPNIVLLYSDDAGWADFGFQEHAAADVRTLTPNIDRIAAEGMQFSQAYMAGVVCSPSRAAMLTGRYQQRFGHENNIPVGYMRGGLDRRQRTIAEHLSARGYVTGLVGKWHLGYPEGYQPNDRGFDEFIGLLQGSRRYHPIPDVSPHRVIQHNGVARPEAGYVTDRFGDAACAFIREYRDRPFFLFVSFTAPHGPLQPRHEDEAFLAGLGIERKARRNFAGLMHALDQNVGRIMATLSECGLDDRTLVIFTNDNGGQTKVGADNGPLHGLKGDVYEGGSRVPMVFRFPGRIAAGGRCDVPVISLDYLPTFMAMAGGDLEGVPHDGVNLVPLLTGEVETLPPRPLF
ncbi:MAG: sulfatase-like hydrolase/transferase [Planctomycetota bacterium]|jgi:arylsulfatase A-like enzyme